MDITLSKEKLEKIMLEIDLEADSVIEFRIKLLERLFPEKNQEKDN